ncbi:MAG: aminodeoxychorismate lyase [Gammaproteobacteria bacterium]|nr:aminodeoxychorismate lyase [Gammaproteobacteria bacterium]
MPHIIISENNFDDSLTQYGDGVFETMLAVKDDIHHWNYHRQRLSTSCQRLEIAIPNYDDLYVQLREGLAENNYPLSVVKMIVSRGSGLRGYRSHFEQPCFVQFSISAYNPTPTLYDGIRVRVCQTRLASQPLLAGMKHINRLEYLMARREPQDSQFDEGLLLDYDNYLIEGLISNIFMIHNNTISTPTLSKSGVAGTMRAYLLESIPTWGYDLDIREVTLDDVTSADSVFLTNATSGIMPVLHIDGIDKKFDVALVNTIRQKVEHPCCAY